MISWLGGSEDQLPIQANDIIIASFLVKNTSVRAHTNDCSVFSVNQGLEQSDTDSFQDSSLKLNVRSGQSRSSSLLSESSSQPEIHPFFKDSYGKFIVLYSYHGQDENDLSVERGQLVTVLNKVTTADVSPRSIISPDECVCWMARV